MCGRFVVWTGAITGITKGAGAVIQKNSSRPVAHDMEVTADGDTRLPWDDYTDATQRGM